MKRSTGIKRIIGIGILSTGVWYFALKNYNYKITFTSTQAPGIIYSNLLQWNNWENENTNAVVTVSKTPFSEIRQEVNIADSVFTYRWVIKRTNDSVTKITVLIKDRENSFLQNLQVPFFNTDFEKQSIATVKKIREALIKHQDYYKVSGVEEGKIPETHCAYIPLISHLKDKGNTMIRNIPIVMNYIKENNIALAGDPFLEVTEWNLVKDTIKFNFCFPVKESDTFPKTNVVKFKTIPEKGALKTRFNGNYKLSDRGWYTLMDYAEANTIKIKNLPVEFYRNDPHSGGDELQWEAEIYMPTNTK